MGNICCCENSVAWCMQSCPQSISPACKTKSSSAVASDLQCAHVGWLCCDRVSCTDDKLPVLSGAGKMVRRQHLNTSTCLVCLRDLDKQEAEIREKLKQEKKREERKNREAFSELLREDMDEGFIKPKMRWKVTSNPASLTWLSLSSSRLFCAFLHCAVQALFPLLSMLHALSTEHQPVKQCLSQS